MKKLSVNKYQQSTKKGEKKLFWAFALLVVMVVMAMLASGSQAADDDLAKKLVGRWEGGAATKTGANHVLVVESVSRDGDQLTASGRYGDADKNGGKVSIKITQAAGDVTLEFTAPGQGGRPVQLKLVGDRDRDGTMRTFAGKRMVNADMHLKKIE